MRHKHSKMLYALKIASKAGAEKIREKDVRIVQDEAYFMEMLSGLRNKNLVRVFDTFEDLENYFMVMEYARHGTLFDSIVERDCQLMTEENTGEVIR